ncbi:protein Tube-like [Teleopsis dalmanni]|uniref:protein Tube-like n=1 Tax=Teleopsis dalmanni TaxID=139649 RepID=UPI000D32B468|nr:protein Tube-like [Teleopsis dalmanni]
MYTRKTELRHLQPNDVYKLGLILDDNNCWKKLMEVIPKELNNEVSSDDGMLDWDQAISAAGLKYNNDDIWLIESATKRPGESRLFSQILFDEWSTSGRRFERPTIGVLIQLLLKAELYRAADFVALNFLNEPPPARPTNGPAAKIDISLPDDLFNDIKDIVNDSSYYPGTETINHNANYANSSTHNNKDFYTKYQRIEKQVPIDNNDAPKPPPRALRAARLQTEQANEASTAEAGRIYENNVNEAVDNSFTASGAIISQNIPKFSALMTNENESKQSVSAETNAQSQNTESTNLSEAPIPMLSVLVENSTKSIDNATHTIHSMTDNEILPNISVLNLNGERDDSELLPISAILNGSISPQFSEHSHRSSLSNDDSIGDDMELPANLNGDDSDNDDDDNSIPNLSILEQRSSNNDSSLTTVTGTSGENSFELSMNDSSSASNENIPCLSALKP